MKRARTILSVLAAGLIAANLGAQSLTVQYVEGGVSQRNAGTWSTVSIGDAVPLSASVKLERLGLVQLRAPGSSITLTQPGTYVIKDLVAAAASLRSAGAVEAAAVAFSRVLRGSGKMVNAVGGVRSEMAPPLDGQLDAGGMSGSSYDSEQAAPSEPVPEPDPAHAAIDRARDLIASGQYQEAITTLRDAIPRSSESEAREASFYLASAFELNGDARGALAALKAANPKGTDDWAPDSILLGARLLEDTFAWAQARDLLVRAATTLAIDQDRAPSYYFLLALAYRGTGETAREKAALDNVIALDPGSELAVAAARLR